LDLAVVLPQILILLAFLALGREVRGIGLWSSSIGMFGAMWLMKAMYAAFFNEAE
jgi:hypothetical protein